MTVAYADLSDLQAGSGYIFQYASDDDDLLTALLLRASRIFDTQTGHSPGYFGPVGSASDKVIIGDGSNYLTLPPYVSIASVSVPAGYDTPTYIEVADDASGRQYLVRTYQGVVAPAFPSPYWQGGIGSPFPSGIGWLRGVPVTVNATWGYTAVPEDVKQAVIELTVAMFRAKDPAYEKVLTVDGSQILTPAMPPRVQAIADRYRENRRVVIA